MRPGPGLVVMALAFISGARRGTSQQISASQGGKLGKFVEDSTGALSRVNPWLSACDLAQPNSAPDLQGQCSAGTLPVALINEGPGPPRCLLPCNTSNSHDKNINNMITNNNNKNNNNNNKNNNKSNNYNNNKSNNNNINTNNNNILNNNIDTNIYNMMENRLNVKQTCLDYLGDNEEFSPAQICKKSSIDIATKLKTLRLRHCCERTAISALHNTAYTDVLNGGVNCIKNLNDLLETDALAARITCEFTEVLIRYDCGQPYSIIHHCEDCKEAYRRWVCSVFVPYFDEPTYKVNNATTTTSSSATTTTANRTVTNDNNNNIKNNNNINSNNNINNSNLNNTIDKNRKNSQNYTSPGYNDMKRSRRKSNKRVRIRPCLSVCQTVEKICPYMLPGDRAPAHPTQYAGEPTFLCLDQNIGETGEQLHKSNNGPNQCCYSYCGFPGDGVCYKCELDDNPSESLSHKYNKNMQNNSTTNDNDNKSNNNFNKYYDYSDETFSEIPEQSSPCQSISTTISTSPTSGQCSLPHAIQTSSSVRASSTAAAASSSASSISSPSWSSSTSFLISPSATASSSIVKRKMFYLLNCSSFNYTWILIIYGLLYNCVATLWTKILLQLAGS